MGRSGVGGGGGGRSGGGRSGGSRSSGRSSMGSSSSRSFSSSSRSSSGSRSSGRSAMGGSPGGMGRNPGGAGRMGAGPGPGGMGIGPRPVGMGAGMHSRPVGGVGRVGRRGTGGIGAVIVIVIWLVIMAAAFSGGGDSYRPEYSQAGSSDITKSTVNRDKLNLKLSDEAGYFTDECGWIRNRTTLEKGLKEFYDSTGIIPYVYIINNVSGDYDPSTEKLEEFAKTQYGTLFNDEGHALLVFWDYAGAYEYVLWLGDDAAELMDTEACDILFDYLDYYYYYADTDEEFFADAFADAGKRIMSVTRSPVYYIIIVVIVGAAAFAVYKVWKSRKDKEAERKKRAEEILNSPLEKFGDNGDIIDELEKKYDKEI